MMVSLESRVLDTDVGSVGKRRVKKKRLQKQGKKIHFKKEEAVRYGKGFG